MQPLPKKARPGDVDTQAVFESDSLEGWCDPASEDYDGLLVKRQRSGEWDGFARDVDEAIERFGDGNALVVQVAASSERQFSLAVEKLLATAALPQPLNDQILRDACALGRTWRKLCPAIDQFDVKLEIFGENTCARWHRDYFVGRAIVSYTGPLGTEYTGKANVNFDELLHCGKCEHCIHDAKATQHVAVGDILLIKGTKYPAVANALVHKSPEKRYDADGKIISRLVLKVDVSSLPSQAGRALRAPAVARAIKVETEG